MIWGVQKNYGYTLIHKFEFLKKWFGLQDKNWVKFANFNLVCDTNSAFQMYVLISSVIVESSHKKTKQPTQNENTHKTRENTHKTRENTHKTRENAQQQEKTHTKQEKTHTKQENTNANSQRKTTSTIET